MNVDYLIIGQGISGTLLSRSLLREGKKVVVVDDGKDAVASKIASGVVNPVTGKRLVRTWMIDQLLPFALDTYTTIGNELGVQLVQQCDILDFHLTQDGSAILNDKLAIEKEYLSVEQEDWSEYFRFNYGIGKIAPCLLIDIQTMLAEWRKKLAADNCLLEEKFDWNDFVQSKEQVICKSVIAQKVILCNGAGGIDDRYFSNLPWSKDKGEALIVSIPGLPRTNIYKQGISIVPWQDDLFWVGATHDWKFTDMQITPAFRKQVEEQLNYWLKLPYKIIDHIVAQRPANLERKPFVGLHPLHPAIGIFNGMGSKGCSMAPYFANMFARHLVHNESLQPDVDVKRFKNVLSR
ncbi:MAG: dependent oxidoreductase [Flavipsychrobacter sp.]|jgi:glycine/D-amino acid oxidase-like deaminating enzyme|nr:dependent oxidoreductase [Flavipsychrobacter sp.]